jgi:hypothetical protein
MSARLIVQSGPVFVLNISETLSRDKNRRDTGKSQPIWTDSKIT